MSRVIARASAVLVLLALVGTACRPAGPRSLPPPAFKYCNPADQTTCWTATNAPAENEILSTAFEAPRYYQCPKWSKEDVADPGGAKAHEVQWARLFVDSRWNADEEGKIKAGALSVPYWQNVAEKGITTCNWVLRGHKYRIDVKGTYRYVGGRATFPGTEVGCAPRAAKSLKAMEWCEGRSPGPLDSTQQWEYWVCGEPKKPEIPGDPGSYSDVCWEPTNVQLRARDDWGLADAECSTRAVSRAIYLQRWPGVWDPDGWAYNRLRGRKWFGRINVQLYGLGVRTSGGSAELPIDHYDLYVDEGEMQWTPKPGTEDGTWCSTTHEYFVENWAPPEGKPDGPLLLRLIDIGYWQAFNSGCLTVEIRRTDPPPDAAVPPPGPVPDCDAGAAAPVPSPAAAPTSGT